MADITSIAPMTVEDIPKPENWILEYDLGSNWYQTRNPFKRMENCWYKTEWIEDLELDSLAGCFNQLDNRPNLTQRSIRSIFDLSDDFHLYSIEDLASIQETPNGFKEARSNLSCLFAKGFPVSEYIYDYLTFQYNDECTPTTKEQETSPLHEILAYAVASGSREWSRSILKLNPLEQFALFQADLDKQPMFRMGDLPILNERFQMEGETSFLSGPIWNCSLDYLHKLSFSFWLLALEIENRHNDKELARIFLPNALLLHIQLKNIEAVASKLQPTDKSNIIPKISLIRLVLDDLISLIRPDPSHVC